MADNAGLDLLADLVERTKRDAGAPFEGETLLAIWELEQNDLAAYERLRAALKAETECRMTLLRDKLEEIGKAVRQKQRAKKGNGGQAPDNTADHRRVIRIEAGAFTSVAIRAEAAIVDANLPVYVGAAGLVYPTEREVETAEGLYTTLTVLVPITTPMMLQFMDQAARYEKYDKRSESWLPAKPPRDIADLIIARKGNWPFPEVIGVIAAPTIGWDGKVISKPGLDRRSKLLLSGAPAITVAENPTKEDALAALETLDDLLIEYQFEDDASRSVALSMLISPLCRGLLPLVPLHVLSAPVAGSGKSFLASLASAILTGRRCPIIPPTEKPEEFEKRLIGALLRGMPIVSFDNVNGTLDDGTLCQAVEQRIIEVRPLGSSGMVTVEQRTTWLANGNNIEIAQDLTRRTLKSRISRQEERPELHVYDHQPFDEIIRNRGKYIAAALTIVRAYILAGRPGRLAPLASYEEWSDNIRSALVWLGCADPCDSMASVRATDSKLQWLRTLFATWSFTLGLGMEYTARQIIDTAQARKTGSPGLHGEPATDNNAELWDAIYDCCGGKGQQVEAKALGEYFHKNQDRVVGLDLEDGTVLQIKLVRSEDKHTKVAKWRLEEVAT